MVQQALWNTGEGTVEKKKRVQVVRVEMVKERSAAFTTNKVSNPQEAAGILTDFTLKSNMQRYWYGNP